MYSSISTRRAPGRGDGVSIAPAAADRQSSACHPALSRATFPHGRLPRRECLDDRTLHPLGRGAARLPDGVRHPARRRRPPPPWLPPPSTVRRRDALREPERPRYRLSLASCPRRPPAF